MDGRRLPDKRITFLGGEMTMSDLRKSDHGVYECVVSNEVATIVARTALLIGNSNFQFKILSLDDDCQKVN